MPYEQLVLTAQDYDKKSKMLKWLRIFLFESSASILLVYGIMCSQFETPSSYPPPPDYVPRKNPGHSGFQSMCLFLVLCFSGQLTGGLSNPAISLSLIVAKNNRITPLIGFVYIIVQFIGSFIGGALVYLLIPYFTCPKPATIEQQLRDFGGEIFGSFFICLFTLIILNRQTTFIDSIFWSYILIPIVYLIGREATNQIDGLNPAVILTEQVFVGIKYGQWQYLQSYWVYIVGPSIGAILAGIVFNLFYEPYMCYWKKYNEKFNRLRSQKDN